MASPTLEVAPVLSTPETHIFEDPTPAVDVTSAPRLTAEQLYLTYEIQRTVEEIRAGRWRRIALQFPDHMLVDAPRVYEALSRGLAHAKQKPQSLPRTTSQVDVEAVEDALEQIALSSPNEQEEKLYILGDTSYGACCVDEIAAEHVDADVIVHYGRSCLSPTARLPVIYIYTSRPLNLEPTVEALKETYPYTNQKVILMADVPYSSHLPELGQRLREHGYANIFITEIIHDPSSPLPNRTIPTDVAGEPDAIRDYQLFHIADPPTSLLLTLSSRLGAIHIYPTESEGGEGPRALLVSSAMTLRRRYALLTRLSTVPIFGILINTLSVKNYLGILGHVKEQIAAAGKKSYTFVVGKINAAKVANFSEVGGWVVIGCWESSLMESKDFWKPIITPFELGLALKGDAERVWTGEWSSDFQAILEQRNKKAEVPAEAPNGKETAECDGNESGDIESEEESEPPEFDLRTGRYVSHSRPMRTAPSHSTDEAEGNGKATPSKSLVRRANSDVAQVGGVVSPGAEFLKTQRTWQGLGSDFEMPNEDSDKSNGRGGAMLKPGRSGIARGYVAGGEGSSRS